MSAAPGFNAGAVSTMSDAQLVALALRTVTVAPTKLACALGITLTPSGMRGVHRRRSRSARGSPWPQ